MTDRPPGRPHGVPASSDDPTRDVRLPPLSARSADPQPVEAPESPAPDPTVVLKPRTDEPAPFAEPLRQQTRPLGAPGGQAPAAIDPEPAGRSDARPPAAAAPGPQVRSGARPWTWVLLAVLPVLVIVVAGVLLFLLLGGA